MPKNWVDKTRLRTENIHFSFILQKLLGSRSRSVPGVFGSFEPEPTVKKKPGTGAAPKKKQEAEPQKIYRLLDKKLKETVYLLPTLL